ncbi:hypothetical protein [Ferruginibacter sp. HRS2-29]|uniref:hypothetical protein n=1 Tax=Ferruginibacter sp. HRS2-29 TaxID=2487334 RepID=UPI0020CB8BB3|nr:hypothetical protein [Ferruginibacter sp. HRS2-29]MCP9750570.1 hypothetical protein [Ferruginibacter sp. HRS2-29]
MKYIRFILVLLAGFVFNGSQAQITTYINGKPLKAGSTIDKADLKTLEISFKNPKLPSVISGKALLYVQINDAKDRSIEEWYILRDGYEAFTDFLKSTPATKKFKVFEGNEFRQNGNDLNWVLSSSLGQDARQKVKVVITLFFRQEIGYKEYGQAVNLLEPASITVPLWDTKNLFLPYLDLSIDKTNIPGDIDLKQNGRLGDKGTELGYHFKDKNANFYSIYALDSKDYPGLNAKELADDFIHAAALYASQDYVTKFSNYDIEKYTIPWDDINNLLSERRRIPSLSWKNNKDIKKMDLMTLYTPVTINGLKGYMFSGDEQARIDRSSKWQDKGKFVIYILEHPSNPDLTLVTSISLYNEVQTTEEIDSFLKTVINSIKH